MAVTKYLQHPKLGPDIDLAGGTMTASVVYRMAGSDYATYLTEILGGSTFIGGRIIATQPQHPDYSWLLLTGVSRKDSLEHPKDDGTDADWIDVTHTYTGRIVGLQGFMIPTMEIPVPTAPAGTWFSRQDMESGVELQTLPGQHYKWKTSNKVLDELDVGILRSVTTHAIMWHNVPASGMPWGAWRTAKGHVNEKVTARFWVCTWDADEVLFFQGWNARPRYTDTGDLVYDVTFRFIEKAFEDGGTVHSGWNMFYNPASNDWEEIVREADGTTKAYPSTDFLPLFQLASP